MTKRKTQTYRGISFTRPEAFESYAPTLKQVRNLIDMAAAIQNSPPPKFEMGWYGSVEDASVLSKHIRSEYVNRDEGIKYPYGLRRIGIWSSDKTAEEVNICGTSCCALGTAAYHGVGKMTKDMDWVDYSEESFSINEFSNLYRFLFSGSWSGYDNTPEGAAARILMLVVEGPEAVNSLYHHSYYGDMTKYYQKYKGIKIND